MARRCYHFDRWGTYLGYVDLVGRYFDREGNFRGAVSRSGAVYDAAGIYRGHIGIQGQYWDEAGVYRGYLRPPSTSVEPEAMIAPQSQQPTSR